MAKLEAPIPKSAVTAVDKKAQRVTKLLTRMAGSDMHTFEKLLYRVVRVGLEFRVI